MRNDSASRTDLAAGFVRILPSLFIIILGSAILASLGGYYTAKAVSLALQIIAYFIALLFLKDRKRSAIELIEDLAALVLLQLIVRNFIRYASADVVYPWITHFNEILIPIYSGLFSYYRHSFNKGTIPLALIAIQLITPYNAVAYAAPHIKVGSEIVLLLLVFNLFIRAREDFGSLILPPKALLLFISVYGASFIAGLFLGFSLTHVMDNLLKFLLFLSAFFYALQVLKDEKQLLFLFAVIVIHSAIFAVWMILALKDTTNTNTNTNFVGGLNLNTAAMTFEAVFFTSLGLVAVARARIIKALWAVAAVLFLVALWLCNSRSAFAGVAFGVVVVPAAFAIKRVFDNRRLRFALLYCGTFLGLLMSLSIATLLIGDHTFQSRILLWKLALAGVAEKPLTVLLGTGDYGPYFLFRHQIGDISRFAALLMEQSWLLGTHLHNDYLTILYGSGIVGLLSFLGIAAFPFKIVVDDPPPADRFIYFLFAGFVALLIHGGGDPTTTSYVTGIIFWLPLAGIISVRKEQLIVVETWGKNIRCWPRCLALAIAIFAVGTFAFELQKTRIFRPIGQIWALIAQKPDVPSPPNVIIMINRSLFELERLNTLFPLSDVNLQIYSELSMATLPHRFKKDSPAAKEEGVRILKRYCRAARLSDYPPHFRRIEEIRTELNLRTDPVCGLKPDAFSTVLALKDPYNLATYIPFPFMRTSPYKRFDEAVRLKRLDWRPVRIKKD